MICGGSRGGARGPRVPPLFLDQTEARGAEKDLETAPPPLSQGLYDRPPAYLNVCIQHLVVGNKAKFG